MFKMNSAKVIASAFVFWAAAVPAPAQSLKTLVNFDVTDGALPLGVLVQGLDGNFYGTTQGGGNNANGGSCVADFTCGTVFKVSPGGAITTLYDFCSQTSCADGASKSILRPQSTTRGR